MADTLLLAVLPVRADLCWHVCNILLANFVFICVRAACVSMETHLTRESDSPSWGCFISGEQKQFRTILSAVII